MTVLGEPLFFSRDGVTLADVLRFQATEGLNRAVATLASSSFSNADEELAANLASMLRVAPLKVAFEHAEPNVPRQ